MITFPRDLPDVRMLEVPAFELSYASAINRTGAGELEIMETGDPVWHASFTTEPVAWRKRMELSAWAASLRGGLRTFLAYDPFRCWPAFYGPAVLALTRAGGGAFDGSAKLTAIGANTITIATLPAGYQVSLGDMVSLVRPNAQRSLHQFVEAATADGSGIVTGTVEPAVPDDATINSTALKLVKAPCVMVLQPDSFKAPAGLGKLSATFEAVQTTAPQS